MLEKRVIDVPFTAGPDDKINPHLRAAGQLSKLENCYQQKHGKVQRRLGQALIGKTKQGGGSLSAVHGLHSIVDDLLLEDSGNLYLYGKTQTTWRALGAMPNADVSARSIAAGPWCHTKLEAIKGSSYTLYIHTESSVDATAGLFPSDLGYSCITIVDDANGSEVYSSQRVNGPGSSCYDVTACCISGNLFAVFMCEPLWSDVYVSYYSVGTSGVSIDGPYTIASDRTAVWADYRYLDCCKSGSGYEATVIYKKTAAAGNGIGVVVVDDRGNVQHSATIGGTTPHRNACCVWQASHSLLYVLFWNNTPALQAYGYDENLSAAFGPVTINTPAAGYNPANYSIGLTLDPDSSSNMRVFWTQADDYINQPMIRTGRISSAGAASSVGDFAPGHVLISHPFTYGSKLYVYAHVQGQCNLPYNDGTESYSAAGSIDLIRRIATSGKKEFIARFLVNQHPGAVVDSSGLAMGVFGKPWETNLGVRRVATSGDKAWTIFTRADRSQLAASTSAQLYDSSAVTVSTDFSQGPSPSFEANGCKFFGGGHLRIYDGDSIYVAGVERDHPDFQMAQVAGGTLADGTYGVAIAYRWLDGQNNEYWSAPMFKTIDISAGGGNAAIRLSIAASTENWVVYNRITDKDQKPAGKMDICIFRTTGVAGTIYYADKFVQNIITSISTTVDIGLSSDDDSDIGDNATIYTTGGELATMLPPCPHHMATDGSTAALIPGDNRETIWVSKPIVRGIGVGFTDELVYDVKGSGPAEALVFMDGRLIVFCLKGVRVMIGNPPRANGEDGYSDSELIVGCPGCISWRSVLLTPAGVIYQSTKGFYLLGRDLTCQYVGAPVESYNSQLVKSAVVMEELNQARFIMSGGDVIVFDWDHGNWPRFTGLSAVASTILTGDWVVAKSDATIGKEDGTTWRDYGSTTVTAKVRTGWLRVGALQGFERVRRAIMLAVASSSASPSDRLTVKAYYNFDESTATTLVNAVTIGETANAVIEERITLPVQKCTAVMLEFEWYSYADKEAMSLTGVSFECAAKKGAPRLAAANTR